MPIQMIETVSWSTQYFFLNLLKRIQKTIRITLTEKYIAN